MSVFVGIFTVVYMCMHRLHGVLFTYGVGVYVNVCMYVSLCRPMYVCMNGYDYVYV